MWFPHSVLADFSSLLICSHALQPDPCNIMSFFDEDVEDNQDDHVDRDGYDDQDDHDEYTHLQPCPAA